MRPKRINKSIRKSILKGTLVPLMLAGILVTIFYVWRISELVHKEIEDELINILYTVNLSLNELYPGEYSEENGELLKGDILFNGRIQFFDVLREQTDLHYTLYHQDVSVATTVYNVSEGYLVGNLLNPEILNVAGESEKAVFYPNVVIGTETYCAAFLSLVDDNDNYVGMLSVAKPREDIVRRIIESVYPVIICATCLMIAAGILSYNLSDGLIRRIRELNHFVNEIAESRFECKISEKVLEVFDEIGIIGTNMQSMKEKLRRAIELDTLTGIYNRGTCNRKLAEIESRSEFKMYSIVMCDIDFFKKVNDTYGHDAGDIVLKKVTSVLNYSVKGIGFCARTGGEEFLLVMDGFNEAQAKNIAVRILERIRGTVIEYGDNIIPVTMTFGVVQAQPGVSTETLIKEADNKLYFGKENGRNQVVC